MSRWSPKTRAGRLLTGTTIAVLVLAVLVGGLLRVRLETDVHSFLPAEDEAVATYDRLTSEYGGDPVVVLLEGGAITESKYLESLLRLEGRLAQMDGVATVYGPATMLNQIAGRAQDLLAQLVGRRDAEVQRARAATRSEGGSPADIKAAGDAARNRFDLRYGRLLVEGMPGGSPTLRNPRFVKSVMFGPGQAPRPLWRFVVPSHTAVAVLVRPKDGLSSNQLSELVGAIEESAAAGAPDGAEVTVSGSPSMVTAMADRAVDDVPMLGAFAVLLMGLCLAAATWVRRSRRLAPLAITLVSVSGTAAALGWLGRPLSLGVVAFGSVLLGLGCYYPTYLTVGARTRTVLVVAAATSVSLATLTFSPIPLVRDLGLALGLGVVLSTATALPLRSWLRAGLTTDDGEPPAGRRARRTMPLLLLAGILAAVGWSQLPDLPVRSDLTEFAGGLDEYDEATHIADVVGSSGEVDLVLRGPDTMTPRALAWMRETQDFVVTHHGDSMRPIISAPELLDFLGDEPTQAQIDAALRILPGYLSHSVVSPDRTSALLTFGVRLEDLGELRRVRDDVLANLPPPPGGYTVEATGLPVVAMKGEDLISADRVFANALGVGAAALVLLLLLRRRSDALRALAAGALATGLGFFLLWATGSALNPVTATLGALTAAVGCEFTVVQATAVRSGRGVLRRAVLLGAATSSAGYAVLLFSGLPAVRALGFQLTVAVLLALAASWLVVRTTVNGSAGRPAAPPERVDPMTREPEGEPCHA